MWVVLFCCSPEIGVDMSKSGFFQVYVVSFQCLP